jgi:pimeloyl-ACP methyl ester carboxylesterase
MPTVQRPTCTLFYEDTGPADAPAVLLMPSLLCDVEMFAHLAKSLADRYRVLHLEMRGHGRSSAPSRRFTQEDQADDVAAVLDHARVPIATLVGLSQGGFAAMRAALYHPTRVRALVLLNTSAAPEVTRARLKYMALAASALAVGVTEPVAKAVLPLMFSEGFLRDHPDTVEHWKRKWLQLDGRGTFYAVDAVANRGDIRAMLPRISAPTLVISGQGDRALAAEKGRAIADAIAGAKYVELAGAGHLSTVEQPEESTRVVRAFLDALDR